MRQVTLTVRIERRAEPAGETDGGYRSIFSSYVGDKAPPQLTRMFGRRKIETVGEASRKRRARERDDRAIRESQHGLLQKNLSLHTALGRRVCLEPSPHEKMSEILIEYATPLMEAAGDDIDIKKKALTLAMAIWNIALLPDNEHIHNIDELANALRLPSDTDDFRTEYRQTAMFLLKRKKQHFSNIRRLILDINFVETTDGFHVNVVSSPTAR